MKQTDPVRRPLRRGYALPPALALVAVLTLAGGASARQWTTSANSPDNISNGNAGNVGVGTTAPAYGLHVDGASTATNNFVQGFFRNPSTTTLPYGGVAVDGYKQSHVRFMLGGELKWQWRVGGGAQVDDLRAFNWALGKDVLTMTDGGNVGVGTTSPMSRLHVDGGAGFGTMRVSGAGMGAMNFEDTSAQTGHRLYQWRSQGGVFRMTLLTDNGIDTHPNILAANSAGNVGVGLTPSPSSAYRLDVNGSVNSTGLCLGGDCRTAWSQVSSQWASGPGPGISYGGGNVGIGTASPAYKLQVVQGSVGIQNSGGDATVVMTSGVNNQALTVGWGTGGYAYLQGGVWGVDWKPIVLQAGGGHVGIGPVGDDPAHTLEVAGTIHASGAITGATLNATYQDVAEWVPSAQKLSAGTVVVLDTGRSNHVVASGGAYDTKVAGVVSAEPGVILGVPGEGKVKVATTGRVRVKVDASRGAIKVGDLLVTSDVEGVGMRSEPILIGGRQMHAPGTIIGKALEPLEKGVGEILVLLSLQ